MTEVAAREALLVALGVTLPADLLDLAVTHRSYAYEHGGLPTNERLEFLGDSVLGVVVTDLLYRSHPTWPEGRLAKMRAAVVNARALADVARGLGLGPCLRLGRGERSTGGQDKSSILADALEAIIGAIYLEHGIEVAADVVTRHFQPLIVDAAGLGAGLDWKTSLQELTAERGLGVPDYVVKESGPDHAKHFTSRVRIGANLIGHGAGRSKKEAEQEAAESAYRSLAEGAAEADDAGTA